jgi:proteic killer suppression protein
VIRSFKDKETEKVYRREFSRKMPKDVQPAALRKLKMLHNSHGLHDLMTPPGNKLEKLAGDRMGQHSIRINDQWRICFVWEGNDAYEVEIVDYH